MQWVLGMVAMAPVMALVAGCGGGASSTMLHAPAAAPSAAVVASARSGALTARSVVRTGATPTPTPHATPTSTPRPTPTPLGGVRFEALTYSPFHANDVMNYRQTVTLLGQTEVLSISNRTGAAVTVTNGVRSGQFFPVRQINNYGKVSFIDYRADTAAGEEDIGSDAGVGNHPAGTLRYIPPRLTPNGLGIGQSKTVTDQAVGTLDYAVIKTHIATVKVVGLETVTVPAGTFHNCLKMIVAVTDKDATGHVVGNNGTPFYFWAAPGVGVVKTVLVTGTSLKQELVSFNVGGHTKPLQ